METKEYIVALHEGVDYNQFWLDMENVTSGLPHIPDRAVSITNNRTAFKRLCEYALTDDEADRVRNDSRVIGIEIPVRNNSNVSIVHDIVQDKNFNKTTSSLGNEVNWGLIRHSRTNNVYGSNLTTTEKYNYRLDGSGVDIVISDTGLQADHPEFTDRVIQINWTAFCSTYSGNSYQDTNGHGTHVAGIAAGKTYGWAKGANVIPLSTNDTNPSGEPLDDFEALINWHNTKKSSGNFKPTVVNMSWSIRYVFSAPSSTTYYSYISGGSFQGYPILAGQTEGYYLGKGLLKAYGNSQSYSLPAVYSPYDVALGEVIDAGIIVVRSAGNDSFKVDTLGGRDYGNYVTTSLPNLPGQLYYHRGASPKDPRAITVGSLDMNPSTPTMDQKAIYSCAGPGVDIYAAGTFIMSSCSNTNQMNAQPYQHGDSNYKQVNISGTSMAAPQIAGMSALYLQRNPTATPAEVKSWLLSNSTNSIDQTGNPYYSQLRVLQDGLPRVAFQNLQAAPTNKSYIKDNTNTWREAKAVWVKHSDGTWKQAKSGWKKNDSGTWGEIYKI
jgi:subtilisin family serine protease